MHRQQVASRLTSWLFVGALLLKSAVPMLASAAAGLQGRATAEVCDVYGVDMSRLGAGAVATAADASRAVNGSRQAHDGGQAQHAQHVHDAQTHDAQTHDANQAHHAHHPHDADSLGSSVPVERAPMHGPASRVAHGGDHCALSALAFALASDAPTVVARPAPAAPMPVAGAGAPAGADAAARWAAQLRHAPPASA